MASVVVYAYNREMAQDYYVTPTPPSSMLSRKMILLGGGLVIALLFGAVLLFGSGGNSISNQLQHLSLRIAALQAVVEDPSIRTNLKSQELNQITTELKLTLATSMNTLTPLMTSAGLPEKFDGNITASEADTTTKTKLEDAALNNKFDRVYAETLGEKITSLRALLAETYSLTKSVKLKQALADLDDTLNNAKKRIDALNL